MSTTLDIAAGAGAGDYAQAHRVCHAFGGSCDFPVMALVDDGLGGGSCDSAPSLACDDDLLLMHVLQELA